ncbi:Arf family guanine nucleotide exchange factor SYT1 [Aspergillus lucknowensis]|uniref:Guanyl-nucleotide exchange factor n=1 Tax=Aspergillus lucknowensis TaxID=176173 RepID=A0ABR4M7P1_9EURO
MHWKGLRLGAFHDNESKRQWTEPQLQARHSEQLPRITQSTTNLAPRNSEASPRSPTAAGPDGELGESGVGNKNALPAVNAPLKSIIPNALHSSRDNSNWRRNRFSLMRLRHASDPQLSKSYAKGETVAPPVPDIPPPPTIITTAPTSHELDQPVKRKNKPRILPNPRKLSMDALPEQYPVSNETLKRESPDSIGSQSVDPPSVASRLSTEEPSRLSTTSIQSAGRDRPNGSHRSSTVELRYSDSSRSDQSTGENIVSRTSSPGGASGKRRFRMPRLKRNPAPLFPLPPKPTGSQFGGGGSVSALTQSRSVPDGPTRRSDASDGQDHVSPLPSPSRSSGGLSASRPPLSRKDSSNSATSAHSTPSIHKSRNRGLLKSRARSSTLDSVRNMRDNDHQPSPPLPSSERTSFSTTGRKSLGDILGISQRLRQNSEPATTRNSGSPGGTMAASTPLTKVQSYPEREESDTPATYLTRLEENIPKSTIAGVLSQSGEDFYKTALRKFMRGFSFFGDPVDMSIRKLLMEVELPKETQQIDRFLQSFADRYHECNPGIFASPEQAYFIAFSILILHTDVFNKNNKRKMQKGDYVKNTRGEGVAEDILECFYENISYTPFIRIEDSNMSTRHLAKPRKALFRVPSTEHMPRATREPVDPYALIMDGKLDSLRPSLKDVMNLDDTYGCNPTTGPPDIDRLHQAFAQSGILQIISARSRPDAFMPASMENPADSHPGLVDIKVAKVGLLWRKDPKKKRTRSPWQEWGALLTLSHLYFFKDANWVKSLMAQRDSHQREGRRRAVVFKPPLPDFNPDAMMSTDHAVALLDSSYRKHKNAFLFVRRNSLEEVFLANSEADMDDWLAKLNYAAAFRTTGVGAGAMTVTKYDAQRNRMSRRPSFRSDVSRISADKEPTSPGDGATEELMIARKKLIQQKIREANEALFVAQRQLDDILRNARHLQILTPVHFRAREQLVMAAGRMAAKLKWVRQEIWRTRCHREVLVRELGEENDQAKASPEPQSLRLQIPASNSSLADSTSTASPHVDNPGTPVPKSPGPGAEKPPSVQQVSSPSSSHGGVRRPSLAASVTSPDLFTRVGRPSSINDVKERTKSGSPHPPNGLEREASVLSSGSKMDVSSLASKTSKLTLPGSFDDGEERLLREAGLLETNSSSSRKGSVAVDSVDSESKKEDVLDGSQGERMSRVRHSFHRTLRDSSGGRHGNHPRSKKRDSGSNAAAVEDGVGEGGVLSRKGGSFTVHGKKASIVTFGTDWQNMPPEERLKLRKPTPSEEPRASDTDLASGGESIHSGVRTSMDVPRKVSEETPNDKLDSRSVCSESAVSIAVSRDEPVSSSTAPRGDQSVKETTAGDPCSSAMPCEQAVNA